MARCGCEGLTCACDVQAADSTIGVSGVGTAANPYLITGHQGYVTVADTPTINLSIDGNGRESNPYIITADLSARLTDLDNVTTEGAAIGDVLAYLGGGEWGYQPPSTAPVGAVSVGDCLTGDGSSGDPVSLDLDPDGGVHCGVDGLHIKPTFVNWDHNWHSEAGTLHYGTSDILAEYVRWGQLCWIRFQFSGASGFTGGQGPWHWTVPFPIGTPTGQAVEARIRCKDNRTYLGAAVITTDSNDLQLLMPKSAGTSVVDNAQQQDASSPGPGSGIPLVPGDMTLDDTATSRISFQGWYRIKAGF